MILKQSVENAYGNKIAKGEQVQIISKKADGEVYILPLKRASNDPVGLWVKREAVE
jgi:hypothetical protein